MQPSTLPFLAPSKWRQFRNLMLFLLALLVFKPAAMAQDSAVFVQFVYIKTHPGKQAKYLDLLRNYTKKFNEGSLKQGKIFGWYVNSVTLPTGSSAEYDVVIVTVTNSFKTLFDDSATGKLLFKKVFPDYSDALVDDIIEQYNKSRTIVKREIFEAIAEINPTAPPTKYAVVDFMKATPGLEERYVKLEKDTFSLIHKARAKLGVIKDWAFIGKVLPYAAADTYDYVTANFFDDINSMRDAKYEAATKSAFPGLDINKTFASATAARTMVKTEIWKLEAYIDHTNTPK